MTLCRVAWRGVVAPERPARLRLNVGMTLPIGAASYAVSLGMVPDERSLPVWERVCELLTPTEESLRDRFSGTFYYVDAVCNAAERSGNPAMIPLLRRLRSHAPLRDQVCHEGFHPDFFQERQAMLELGIARALARCGSPEGYEVLAAYLDDVRALLAERAHDELIDLTGVDLGKDAQAWSTWLLTNQPALRSNGAVTIPA